MSLDSQQALETYRRMLKIRKFEEAAERNSLGGHRDNTL